MLKGWPWPPHIPTHPPTFHTLPIHKRRLQNSVKPNSKALQKHLQLPLIIQVEKNTHLDNEQTRKSGTISQKWGIEFSLLEHSRKRHAQRNTLKTDGKTLHRGPNTWPSSPGLILHSVLVSEWDCYIFSDWQREQSCSWLEMVSEKGSVK